MYQIQTLQNSFGESLWVYSLALRGNRYNFGGGRNDFTRIWIYHSTLNVSPKKTIKYLIIYHYHQLIVCVLILFYFIVVAQIVYTYVSDVTFSKRIFAFLLLVVREKFLIKYTWENESFLFECHSINRSLSLKLLAQGMHVCTISTAIFYAVLLIST